MRVNFFKNIFYPRKHTSTKNVLDDYSTFLTPWYFKSSVPNMGENFIWKELNNLNGEDLALTTLNSKNGCVGIIDMYCYIKPLKKEQFLIWNRGTRIIELYNSFDLKPINKDGINWVELNKAYVFNAKPVDSFEYFFDIQETDVKFDFPKSFSDLDEIIQVNELDGMYTDCNQAIGNTAVVILKPKENRIKMYPQDWFNLDKDIDFGYQWITRADRIGTTDKIKIQGIRIGEYVLDDSKRGIIK